MAKTSNNPRIVSRTVRAKLAPRRDPYWHLIAEGQHLGYRRTEQGGTWVARYYTPRHGRRFQALGSADDTALSDGTHVLTFAEALQAAQAWLVTVSRSDANGVHIGPYTVADAAKAWLDKWKGSERSKETSAANVEHHIIPTLGSIEVRKLERETVANWLHELAKKEPVKVQQRRINQQKLSPSRRSKIVYDPNDPETIRKRRESANRVFQDLRALLNEAYKCQKADSKAPWETVDKFDSAQASSEGLSLEEAKRFFAVCPPDFLLLVQAALITGCRYNDLCEMRVSAYEPRLQAIRVKQSKTGVWQHTYLTAEEETFFKEQMSGKRPDDRIFLRSDGRPWGKSHQQDRMSAALKAAKIKRHVRFHDLRHTLGQWLAETGLDMKVISKQLGHSSVKVTEAHYINYTPDYLGKAIRANKPSFLSDVA